MWALSPETLEPFRTLIVALSSTFGLFAISRFVPVYDCMMDQPTGQRLIFDVSLAIVLAVTFYFFAAGFGMV